MTTIHTEINIKLWNRKTYFKTQVMTLNSQMNIQHSNVQGKTKQTQLFKK